MIDIYLARELELFRVRACGVDVHQATIIEKDASNANRRETPAGIAGPEIESCQNAFVKDVKRIFAFDAGPLAIRSILRIQCSQTAAQVVIEGTLPKFFVRFIENQDLLVRRQHVN